MSDKKAIIVCQALITARPSAPRAPGTKILKCTRCITEIYVSPSSLTLMKTHPEADLFCFECMVQTRPENAKLQRPNDEQLQELKNIFGERTDAVVDHVMAHFLKATK